MKLHWKYRGLGIFAFVFVMSGMLLSVGSCSAANKARKVAKIDGCEFGSAVETNGHRRLALIVGVGQYRADSVPDLEGPPNDARRVYELLTAKNGYGFPKENVCMLLDEQATTGRFRQAFEEGLIGRARSNDVVVFYYAGHGSQINDRNGDEPDGLDETFLFHDARTTGPDGKHISDFRDDELFDLLQRLHGKTRHITAMLDSCNSGTATRGSDASTMVARFAVPDPAAGDSPEAGERQHGDGGPDWAPDALSGLIVFTAASDGTSALETGGRGIFTDALLEVMSQTTDKPLTYAQAARQIAPLVAARSYQIPYFQGDLGGAVFGNADRTRPFAWEVISTGPTLKLGGPPLPGLGVGTEMRIYPGNATGAETQDPAKAKATVIIDAMTGVNATGRVIATAKNAAKIENGDLAVPVRVADRDLRIKVRLKPAKEPGGIPAERAKALTELIEKNSEAQVVVELTNGPADFELSVDPNGKLQLHGPENRLRDTYERDEAVAENLWQHARQKAILQLRGEGGSDFVDHQTLQVQLVPAPKQDNCDLEAWKRADANREQVIPLGCKWNVKVTLKSDAPTPLLVGAVILSTDGSSFGLPSDGRKVLLKPGESTVFNARQETFKATPPLDVWDRVVVFGTKETNPVPWHLLTATASTRAAAAGGALYRALDRYLTGTRGTEVVSEEVEESTWTLSTVNMRVVAEPKTGS
jgi:hypothetical protein